MITYGLAFNSFCNMLHTWKLCAIISIEHLKYCIAYSTLGENATVY